MGDLGRTGLLGCGGVTCLGVLVFFIIMLASIKRVEPNEQLVFNAPDGKSTKNGPFTMVVWPHQRHERRKATQLDALQYAIVKDEQTGEIRHIDGPGRVFLGAYDKLVAARSKTQLQAHEYVRLIDTLTGAERVVRGPATFSPDPLEDEGPGKQTAITIEESTALLVVNRTSGVRRIVTEDGLFFPAPYERVVENREGIRLTHEQYAVLKDNLEGTQRTVMGPNLLKVGAYEELLTVTSKVVLQKNQYIRLVDRLTGEERVEEGIQTMVPRPSEESEMGIQDSIMLDTETAVLVLNKTAGRQSLVTTAGIFTPGPYEHVVEVRRKQRCLPHEAIIVRDGVGQLTVHTGTDANPAFFLQPYSQILEMTWTSYAEPSDGQLSSAPSRVVVSKIDMRARKMFFAFEVRTSDNVKLRLQGTIFWRIRDVVTLVGMTSDPEGDVWHRARSALIQQVSGVDLAYFMANQTQVLQDAFDSQLSDNFYAERGVELQSMELTGFDCVDAATQAVMQEIIQEKTNRINRLQAQEGENSVKAARLAADIELERQRTAFILSRANNSRLEAEMAGNAEGTRIVQRAKTFISGLNTALPNVTSRVELYKLHESMASRNVDTHNLASGKGTLFMTASDLNLNLGEL